MLQKSSGCSHCSCCRCLCVCCIRVCYSAEAQHHTQLMLRCRQTSCSCLMIATVTSWQPHLQPSGLLLQQPHRSHPQLWHDHRLLLLHFRSRQRGSAVWLEEQRLLQRHQWPALL